MTMYNAIASNFPAIVRIRTRSAGVRARVHLSVATSALWSQVSTNPSDGATVSRPYWARKLTTPPATSAQLLATRQSATM